MLADSELEKGNRRGCQLLIAALLLVAILVGVLAWWGTDGAESDVAASRGVGSRSAGSDAR